MNTTALLLVLLCALVTGGALGLWWRARSGFGVSRGLPPGSLGLGASLVALRDPEFLARQARRHGSVFKMAQFHRPVVVITDLATGLRVLDDHAESLTYPRPLFGRPSARDLVAFLGDPGHPRYRVALDDALEPQLVALCDDAVADVIRVRLRRVTTNTSVVPVDEWLEEICLAALLRVIVGITTDTEALSRWRLLFDALGRSLARRRSADQMSATLTPLVEQLRTAGEGRPEQSPGPSVLHRLLTADRRHFADDTILGNLALLLQVTRSNLRGTIRWTLWELMKNQACISLVRDAATTGQPAPSGKLATYVVQEVLRRHQSEFFNRVVVREFRLGRYRIPAGWLLRVAVREAHDNPEVFPNPTEFRPLRFADRSFSLTEYCPFSEGANTAFGSATAFGIARAFTLVLALEFEGRVLADGPTERDGNRHWNHWRPSKQFQVRLMLR